MAVYWEKVKVAVSLAMENDESWTALTVKETMRKMVATFFFLCRCKFSCFSADENGYIWGTITGSHLTIM
jgi:hypothetical protein